MTSDRFGDSVERARFVRFLFAGLLNTAFGYAIFAAGLRAGATPALALLVATVSGVFFNFFTTGRLVFGSSAVRRLPRFVLSYCVIYLINLALLTLLTRAGVSALAAQALSLPIVVVCSFLILRRFVFADRTNF